MYTSITYENQRDQAIVYGLPLFVLTSFSVAELVFRDLSCIFSGWPLVLSLFVVGMPHGAVDFGLTARMTASARLKGRLVAFSGYGAILAGSLTLFLVHPPTALIVFFIVSGIHFGLADARALTRNNSLNTLRTSELLSAFARGSFILGLPFLVAPTESLAVFNEVIAITGRPAMTFDVGAVRQIACLVCFAAAVSHAVVSAQRIARRQVPVACWELLETSVIVFTFCTLHPLFSVGLYVLAWHSWRHLFTLAPIFETGTRTPSASRWAWLTTVLQLHVHSLPLLVPTLVLFAVIAWWRLTAWTSGNLAALTIAFFVVVTLPHHILIEKLMNHVDHHTRPSHARNQVRLSQIGAALVD